MPLHVWMRENTNCARDRKDKHLVVYTLCSLYNIPRCKNIYLACIHTVISKMTPKSGSIGYINTLLMENFARWTKRKSCIQNLRKCQSCHLPKHQKQRIKFVRLCSVSSPLNYRLYLKKKIAVKKGRSVTASLLSAGKSCKKHLRVYEMQCSILACAKCYFCTQSRDAKQRKINKSQRKNKKKSDTKYIQSKIHTIVKNKTYLVSVIL